MAKGKYVRDYRLLEYVNERGRVRSDYEYIGDRYSFVNDAKSIGRERVIISCLCAAACILFIAALLPSTMSMRKWFISVPFAFAAFPLGMFADSVISFLRPKPSLEHREADRFSKKMPGSALAASILSAYAFVLSLILNLSGKALPGDVLFSVSSAALAAVTAFAYSRRARLAVKKG